MLVLRLGIPVTVDFLVLTEGAPGDKTLPARGTGKRPIASVKSSMQFVAGFVRKRLMTDAAHEPVIVNNNNEVTNSENNND